jgi:hypothetical protein
MVFNLSRSFFGRIMWSKQDPFQIQIRSDEGRGLRAFISARSPTLISGETGSPF